MLTTTLDALDSAACGVPLSDEVRWIWRRATTVPEQRCGGGRRARDRAFVTAVTFSHPLFLPLTNLCRKTAAILLVPQVARSGDEGEWTMLPATSQSWLLTRGGARASARRSLLPGRTLPRRVRRLSQYAGQARVRHTVDYRLLERRAPALALGLLPHTNPSCSTTAPTVRCSRVSTSALGLMLER